MKLIISQNRRKYQQGMAFTARALVLLMTVQLLLLPSAFALSPHKDAPVGNNGGSDTTAIPPGGSIPKQQQSDATRAEKSSSSSSSSSSSRKEKDASLKPKKKPTNHKNHKRIAKSTTSSQGASITSDFERRVRIEFRDAIEMGIGYDWVRAKKIKSKKKKSSSLSSSSSSSSSSPSSEEHLYRLICLGPLATNLRHWHFSFRGCGIYSAGIYHGVIFLPDNYPLSAPRVQLWTPSGRFVPYRDICLSASSYHPESWTPKWTILSLVQSLRLHMLTNPNEIGGKNTNREDTLEYAKNSLDWRVKFKGGQTIKVVVDHSKLREQGFFSVEEDTNNDAEEEQKQNDVNATVSSVADGDENISISYSPKTNSEEGTKNAILNEIENTDNNSRKKTPPESIEDQEESIDEPSSLIDEVEAKKTRESKSSNRTHNNNNNKKKKTKKRSSNVMTGFSSSNPKTTLTKRNTTTVASNKRHVEYDDDDKKSPTKILRGVISKVFLSSPTRITVVSLIFFLWIISIP